jgi:hypothetical protein
MSAVAQQQKTKKKVKAPEVITAAEILEYVEVCAVNNKSAKRREKLRERILTRLNAGVPCDPTSPYRLGVRGVDTLGISWKEEYVKLMMEFYPEDWEERILKVEADNRKIVSQIVIEANIPAALEFIG